MTKKELIQTIKAEIKQFSVIIKRNKEAFKYNQRVYSKAQTVFHYIHGNMKCIEPLDYKAIECYPFNKLQNGTIEREDGKCYFIGSFYNINPDIETAKFHLTALHSLYNLLRNKKQHCHSKERNDYYVRWNKVINERIQSIKEEVKDANI